MTKRKVKSRSKGEGGFVDTQGRGQEHVLQSRIRGVALVAPVGKYCHGSWIALGESTVDRDDSSRAWYLGQSSACPEVRCKIPPISP
jgi:hypothetical protein